ncbi:MAG: hypothetical protein OWU84_04845 [Firmicutes bacterium]|nr:hypothetical protein [Bacillota bacterium]
MNDERVSSGPFLPPEALPRIVELPDPFARPDGTRVTSPEEWPAQRAVWQALMQFYVYGFAEDPEGVRYEAPADGEGTGALAVQAGPREVRFPLTVTVPQAGEDILAPPPYPVVIQLGPPCPPTQKAAWLAAGYGVIEVPVTAIYRDDASRAGAYTALFPYRAGDPRADTGALRAWAWGASRVLDALEQGAWPWLDPQRAVVLGVSRYGKAALLAAALDARVAMAVPVDAGQAGTASFRYHEEGRRYAYEGNPLPEGLGRSEKLRNMLGRFDHWFSSRMAAFREREEHLPGDAHTLMALVAPRPLLVVVGERFSWLGPSSQVLSVAAAREVYEFLGASGRLAVHVRSGPHAIQDGDVALAREFADHWLRGRPWVHDPDAFPFPNLWARTPYRVQSAYIPWARPGKHRIWTSQERMVAGCPVTLTVGSDGDQVTLTSPSGAVQTVPVAAGQATFALAAEAVVPGVYRLTAEGPREPKTIEVESVPTEEALRVTVSRDGRHRLLHFADCYDRAAVRVWINGVDVTDVEDPTRFPEEDHHQVYRMQYGLRLNDMDSLLADGPVQVEVRRLYFRHAWPDAPFRYRVTFYPAEADGLLVDSRGLALGLQREGIATDEGGERA